MRWLILGSVVLAGLSGLLFIGHAQIDASHGASGLLRELWILHDVGAEHNVPTWYASLLWALLGASGVLAAALDAPRRGRWTVLAVVAVVASIDEYAQLHERLAVLGDIIASALGWELWFTWVIPGILIAVAVAMVLMPLMMELPARARTLILAGGCVFLASAVGMEILGGLLLGQGAPAWSYVLVTLIEETGELLGLSLAIGGVLSLFEVRCTRAGHDVRFRM